MQAVVQTGIGGINKLKFTSLDITTLLKDEVLVKVLYCGINHLDALIRMGKRQGPKNFPHILGSEVVGEVNGEKFVVYPWTEDGGTIGRTKWGGYAQYLVAPKKNLIKIPKGLKEEFACALALAGTTAFHLIERARIKRGSTVLVTGATSVGTALLGILKSRQCQIICATSHKNKIPLLRKKGAQVVSTKNMVSEIKRLYPQGIEYAIDLVGGDVWSDAIETLGKEGTVVFCATSREEMGKVNIGNAFSKQLNILGSYGGTIEDLKEVLRLAEKGILKPVIDALYPLKDAPKAHQRIDRQEIFGKILLKI